MVAGATLVNRMGTMVLPFLVLYLTQHLGYPAGTAGLVLAVYGAGGLVSSPFAGKLCDRIGPLRVMQGALILAGGTCLLFPLAKGLEPVLALTGLLAVTAEAVRPASLAALVGALSPEKRTAAIALNRLAINLGMSVGPAVGGFLVMVSFPLIFVVDGITSIAAGLVLAVMAARSRARAPQAAPAEAAAPALPSASVLRDGPMLVYLSGLFLLGVVFLQHEAAMAVFLVRDLGFRESFYGMLFAVNTLVIVAVEVPLNLAMARWPHRRSLVLGAFLCAAGFGALALVSGPAGVLATVLVWTVGEMVFFPVSASYVADVAPPGRRGEYMGAYATAWGLAFTVGPWAGTAVLDRFGAVTLWTAVFVVGVAAAAVIGRAVQPRPAGEPAPAPLAPA